MDSDKKQNSLDETFVQLNLQKQGESTNSDNTQVHSSQKLSKISSNTDLSSSNNFLSANNINKSGSFNMGSSPRVSNNLSKSQQQYQNDTEPILEHQQKYQLYILHNKQNLDISTDENDKNNQQQLHYNDIVEINTPEFKVGRDLGNVKLFGTDQLISRFHVNIEYCDEKDEYQFCDYSKNGVWVRSYNKVIHEQQQFMLGNYQYTVDEIIIEKNQSLKLSLSVAHNDVDDEENNQEYEIEFGVSTNAPEIKKIGRDPKLCEIVVENDDQLSPIHAFIERHGNKLQVVDQNSETGMWVKVRPSKLKQPKKLYKIENEMEIKLAYIKILKFKMVKKQYPIMEQNSINDSCFFCQGQLEKYEMGSQQKKISSGTHYLSKFIREAPNCQLCQQNLDYRKQTFFYCTCKAMGFFLCNICENTPSYNSNGVSCLNCKSHNSNTIITDCLHIFCNVCVIEQFAKKCPESSCENIISDFTFIN